MRKCECDNDGDVFLCQEEEVVPTVFCMYRAASSGKVPAKISARDTHSVAYVLVLALRRIRIGIQESYTLSMGSLNVYRILKIPVY